jgi:hypothetical protein
MMVHELADDGRDERLVRVDLHAVIGLFRSRVALQA